MLKFYSFILGEDYALLKADTPESRKKVSALATVIFIPVIIWFINWISFGIKCPRQTVD